MSFLSYHYALLLLGSTLAFRFAPRHWRAHVAIAASGIFYASWNLSLCMLMFAAAVFAWQGSRDLRGLPARHPWAGGLVLGLMVLAGLPLAQQDAATPQNIAALQTWIAATASVAALWAANLILPRLGWARRARMAAYVAGLLLLLACFKYANFFIGSFAVALGQGSVASSPLLQILLPVGISFYVFQKISYLADVWRGDQTEVPPLPEFCAYATFFPQLVAGPIERVAKLLPQLRAPLPFGFALALEAMVLILVGAFKKLYVADNCALLANFAFDNPAAVGPAWWLLGSLAFAAQIYGDFSGYTDIARGSALLLGVRLSNNFAMPYLAGSAIDFWRRWHMSLSSWLRDYLYKPLGGARHGPWVKQRNLLIVMALGGLWHGASWNFVLWGIYWGLVLMINHAWRDHVVRAAPRASVGAFAAPWRVLGWAVTLWAVLVGWTLFRATDMSVLAKFLTINSSPVAGELRGAANWLLLHSLPLLALHALGWRLRDEAAALMAWPLAGGALAALALWLTLGSDAAQTAFIYFQF